MAKKASGSATAAEKIKFLRDRRGQLNSVSEGVAALQKEFGTALIFGKVSKALGLKPARPSKKTGAKKAAGKKTRKVSTNGRRKKVAATSTSEATAAPTNGRKKRGRRAAAMGGTGTPQFVVALPGRGRGWNLTYCATREDAAQLANEALERGTDPSRVGIYGRQEFAVKSSPTVSF